MFFRWMIFCCNCFICLVFVVVLMSSMLGCARTVNQVMVLVVGVFTIILRVSDWLGVSVLFGAFSW